MEYGKCKCGKITRNFDPNINEWQCKTCATKSEPVKPAAIQSPAIPQKYVKRVKSGRWGWLTHTYKGVEVKVGIYRYSTNEQRWF